MALWCVPVLIHCPFSFPVRRAASRFTIIRRGGQFGLGVYTPVQTLE